MVSSTDGSLTSTGWNRRSSAGSFSMYFLYSFSVVVPIARSSPRASAGLSMFEASMEPSAAPAPTKVCNSSMNRIICPSASVISFNTAFKRSSNSPRNFAPATSAARSSATSRLVFSTSGTSPETMRCARPSTMAVLPTPGSPISTGLFFVRRARICITLRISSSRPITGSSFPRRARSVRSRAYFSSEAYVASGFCDVTRCVPRTPVSACSIASCEAPCRFSNSCRVTFLAGKRKKKVFCRNVLVLESLRLVKCPLQNVVQRLTHVLLRKALHFRQPRDLALNILTKRLVSNAQSCQQGWHHPVRLRYQCLEQMHGFNLLILVARRHVIRLLQRFLRFHRQLVKSQHVLPRLSTKRGCRIGQPPYHNFAAGLLRPSSHCHCRRTNIYLDLLRLRFLTLRNRQRQHPVLIIGLDRF